MLNKKNVVMIFVLMCILSMPINAAVNSTITIPGDGSTYREYEYETNSPINNNYIQGSKFDRIISDPQGTYLQGDNTTIFSGTTITANWYHSHQILDDGTVMQIITRRGGYANGELIKFDSSYNIIRRTTLGYPITNQFYAFNFVLGQSPSASVFKLIDSSGRILEIDRDANVLNGPYTVSGYPSIVDGVGGNYVLGTSITSNGYAGSSITVSHLSGVITKVPIFHVDSNLNALSVIELPMESNFTPHTPTENAYMRVKLTELKNGKVIVDVENSSGRGNEIQLCNANFTSCQRVSPTLNVDYLFLSEIKSGDFIIAERTDALGNSVNANYMGTSKMSRLYLIDKDTGTIKKELDFHDSETNFNIGAKISNVSYTESVLLLGTTNVTGKFQGYGTDAGPVLVSFDDNLNMLSASVINAEGNHTFRGAAETEDGRIFVTGDIRTGTYLSANLFDEPIGGFELAKGLPSFIGSFELTLNEAPKLPSVSISNVVIDSTMSRDEIDEAMLSHIVEVMKNGTTDIENNQLDDHMSNTELLKRINKNVNNPDYANENIDWSLFGLSEKENEVTSEKSYEIGPYNEVTYAVSDNSLLQTVTSQRVNILDELTLIDHNNMYALRATDFRVNIDEIPNVDYISEGEAKAWNLNTQSIETMTNVNVDTSNVQNKVGVYKIIYNYTHANNVLKKEVYMTVYNEDAVFGPIDNNPENPLNTEMLYAVDGEYRLSRVSGKTIDQLTEFSAWDLTTGAPITTKTTVIKDTLNNIVSFDNTKASENHVVYTLASGTNTEVVVKLVEDTAPVIVVNPKTVEKKLNQPLSDGEKLDDGISVTDLEDNADGVPLIYTKNKSKIDVAMKSVQIVKYDAVDSDGNSAKTKIREYIIGYENKPIQEGTIKLVADDFSIKLNDIKNLSDALILEYAYARAWDTESGMDAIISVNNQDLNIIKNATLIDSYTLTLNATNGITTISKKINIKIIDRVSKTIIEANNMEISLKQLNLLKASGKLNEHIIMETNAKSWSETESGKIIERSVLVNATNLENITEKEVTDSEDSQKEPHLIINYTKPLVNNVSENNETMDENGNEDGLIPKKHIQNILFSSSVILAAIIILCMVFVKRKKNQKKE